jgi:hypothetical protein
MNFWKVHVLATMWFWLCSAKDLVNIEWSWRWGVKDLVGTKWSLPWTTNNHLKKFSEHLKFIFNIQK